MRLFLAFSIPQKLRDALHIVQEKGGRKLHPGMVRWVRSDQLHITLEFLGEVPESCLDEVVNVLEYQTKRVHPFLLQTTALDAFPVRQAPRVIVMGAQEIESDESRTLKKNIHDELHLRNLTADYKQWSPHVTIGRVRNEGYIPESFWEEIVVEPVKWGVEEVELMESKLTKDGAVYAVVKSFLFPVISNEA